MDRHVKDTWSVFKIMGEFVEGFETLREVWPAVSVFGGSRMRRGHPYYKQTVALSKALAEAGFSIITGAGPGMMEAANRGAVEGGGRSIGLNIKLPSGQAANEHADTIVDFNYFFARKVMFIKYSCAIVGTPGGFGTLDEIFEVLTLAQTGKIKAVPVILYGSEFWGGLVEWLESSPVAGKLVSRRDMKLFSVSDDVDEVVDRVSRHYREIQLRGGPLARDGHETP
jgi:uncharacterized protein (TIGR00730 family)